MKWNILGLAGPGAHPCGQDECHTLGRLITCLILKLGQGLERFPEEVGAQSLENRCWAGKTEVSSTSWFHVSMSR